MKGLAVLCGCAAMFAATVGRAATFTGSYQGGEGVGSLNLTGLYPDGATLKFTFSSSTPVTGGYVEYTYEYGFNQYFDVTGIYYGGDNEPTYVDRGITSANQVEIFTTPADYNLYYPDGDLMEMDYFSPEEMSVDVFSNAPDGTGFQFSVVAVPEPGAWALMSLGAALVGGGLRRRRRANEAATA